MQVEKAKRYHEKAMRSCQLEEQRLQAAQESNAKDRVAAEEFLRDARTAFATLKAQHDEKLLQQVIHLAVSILQVMPRKQPTQILHSVRWN